MYIAMTLVEKQIYIYPSLNLALVNVPLDSQVQSFIHSLPTKIQRAESLSSLKLFIKTHHF